MHRDRHTSARSGALVISLDFELAWGVRDRLREDASYADQVLAAREIVPRLLALFEERDIGATWAIVGSLFADGGDEWREASPEVRPLFLGREEHERASPYAARVGYSEEKDPLHFAPSLVRLIRDTPHQEIATHTFCHFETLRAAPSPWTFRADLRAAKAIAERFGVELRSLVYPRNQIRAAYDEVLLEEGIRVYRGNPPHWMWSVRTASDADRPLKRAARALDPYVAVPPGPRTQRWSEVVEPGGLANVRAAFFFRPWTPRLARFEGRRLARLTAALERAAREDELLHVWWHPHNFGAHPEENLASLNRFLDAFERLRASHGMMSLNMRGVDTIVRERLRTGDTSNSSIPAERAEGASREFS